MASIRLIVVAVIVVIFNAVGFSQPKLTIVGGSTFSFGDIYNLKTVTHPVLLTNSGKDTLKVWDVSGSCGCTGTLLSNGTLLPGDTGTISVTFDPKRFAGSVSKTISMKTNDPENGKVTMSFSANIIRTLGVEPEYLVMKTVVDSMASDSIFIMNSSKETIKVLSVETTIEGLKVHDPIQEIEPGKNIGLLCTFSPTQAGTVKGDITFTFDHPNVQSSTVRFFSLVRNPSHSAAGKQ